jgi:hypothetical protein
MSTDRPDNADARDCDDPAVLRAALRRLYEVCQAMDAEQEVDRPTEEEYQAAIAQAVSALR